MSSSTKVANLEYVGPRALFDPKYVPPALIHREKELAELSEVLMDGMQDRCPVSVLITGMEGMGKTTLARKAVSVVKQQLGSAALQCFFINCKDQSIEEILLAFIHSIERKQERENQGVNYIEYNLPQLWSYLKALLAKTKKSGTVWILDSVDDLDLQYLLKFVQLGKETGISTIGSHDAPMKSSATLPKSLDIHVNLDQMTPLGIYKVTKQRVNLTFPFALDAEVPRAICDFVDNFDTCRPGTCIRVLKEIYPVVKREHALPPVVLRSACQRQVVGVDVDDFQILNDILENELLAQLFIDNLASHFQAGRIYISDAVLKEQYELAAESIEVPFCHAEFQNAVIALIRTNILRESRIGRAYHRTEYLLVPPPDLLKNAIDVIFAGAQHCECGPRKKLGGNAN
ncbi:MAG TPA: AAA family ATPase [Candidatus Lokiarchaeia archaeon]|nr:AAA family ATPase [Candidatus Lokiarchaeia archaeon]